MNYRYRLHWYSDPDATLNGGRLLSGSEPAQAIAHAIRLWEDGAYAAALGCCVVDTEDGTVVWRVQRDPAASQRSAALNLRSPRC